MHEMCSMEQICSPHYTVSQYSHNHCQQYTVPCILNSPSAKAKVCFEILNVPLCNFCIFYGLKKHSPGGRLAAFAFYPFGQASLHCCLLQLGIVCEARFYCRSIKPHSFKNCPPLACSSSAHMLSEESEIVLTIYRGRRISSHSNPHKSVFSLGCFGGCCSSYCTNVPPYQCFRGCCTTHP